MILIKPSHEIKTEIDSRRILESLERAGRVCYKTEDKIDWGAKTAHKFVQMVLDWGHESVIEHESITVQIICDRGVTHEIVRHRLCAYSQESTRYCDYGGGVTFVIPPWVKIEPGEYAFSQLFKTGDRGSIGWGQSVQNAEEDYLHLLKLGWSPQQARSVLPNSLKTEIVMTANIREWRHVLKLRTSKAAHPQMREVMIPILKEFRERIDVVFDDIRLEEEEG